MALHLTKHEGCGNDFLVLIDRERTVQVSPGEVRSLCDRHRGIGADGLIVGRPGPGAPGAAAVTMQLWNADGSVAEMSGNGIRCLVQAAVLAGMAETGDLVAVETGAGRRAVRYEAGAARSTGTASVDMGPARITGELATDAAPVSLSGRREAERACLVDVGNPHVVLAPGAYSPDIAVIGPAIQRVVDGGANVELVRPGTAPPDGDRASSATLAIEVWERGVGVTESCGTGACAAAAAARAWGMSGDSVEVTTAGGALVIRLEPDTVILSGPVSYIGDVTVEREVLSALVARRRDWAPASL